ncbi:MAG: hypothetical protein KTR31_24260, partial [Myxococcales bacterium]|nr:hypothetical protein [Myxococcales bacterium]
WCASGLGLAFGVACGQWVAAELALGFLATVAVQVTLGIPVMGASYVALGSAQVLLATRLGARPMLPDEPEQ